MGDERWQRAYLKDGCDLVKNKRSEHAFLQEAARQRNKVFRIQLVIFALCLLPHDHCLLCSIHPQDLAQIRDCALKPLFVASLIPMVVVVLGKDDIHRLQDMTLNLHTRRVVCLFLVALERLEQ